MSGKKTTCYFNAQLLLYGDKTLRTLASKKHEVSIDITIRSSFKTYLFNLSYHQQSDEMISFDFPAVSLDCLESRPETPFSVIHHLHLSEK